MYHSRRRSRHERERTAAHDSHRQFLITQRRRRDKLVMRMLILGPLLIFITFELGRSLFHMQRVKMFATVIEQLPPDDVKSEVTRFATGLYSANPLIRNGSIAALRIATGWNAGADANEWKRLWAAQEANWQYRSRSATNAPAPASPDWRKDLPPGVTPEAGNVTTGVIQKNVRTAP